MHVEPGARRLGVRAGAALLFAASAAAQAQPSAALLAACATCHGADGNATIEQFPSLAGQPKLFLENQLVLIREGLRDVAVMKDVLAGIPDDGVVALAKHFSALPLVRKPVAVQAEKAQQGAQAARRLLCGTCHLPDFTGQAQVPRLAGQNEAYLLLALKQFRDAPGPGRDTIMAASLYGASDTDLANLAHFLATFSMAKGSP